MFEFIANRTPVNTSASPGTVLLDFLRDELQLKGTKEGCREGDCGACTVLVGRLTDEGMAYHTAASCLLPIGALHGRHIVTIEGLTENDLSAIQQAIVDEGATQCGFCTPGIVVALAGFLLNSTSLSVDDGYAAVEGNICRCTGYASIRRAIVHLVDVIPTFSSDLSNRVTHLVDAKLLPAYFTDIAAKLKALPPATSDSTPSVGATRVAGGTDLFVQRAESLLETPLHFLDTPDLRGIRREANRLVIGGGTTVEELLHAEVLLETFPGWKRSLRLVSSTLIRNRATPAGNIVNASPIGDLTIMLLALDAELTIHGPDGVRQVALSAFYHGYKSFDLADEEWITTIAAPIPPDGARYNFEKVSRREHLDIASVNSAMQLVLDEDRIADARLSAGGVGPVPLFLRESSDYLRGKPLTDETVSGLLKVVDAEIAPISDVRGSEVYKRRLLRRLVIAHFTELCPDLELVEGAL